MAVELFSLKNAKGIVYSAWKTTIWNPSLGIKQRDAPAEYRLADGRMLVYDIVSDTFEVIGTGEKLVRILR